MQLFFFVMFSYTSSAVSNPQVSHPVCELTGCTAYAPPALPPQLSHQTYLVRWKSAYVLLPLITCDGFSLQLYKKAKVLPRPPRCSVIRLLTLCYLSPCPLVSAAWASHCSPSELAVPTSGPLHWLPLRLASSSPRHLLGARACPSRLGSQSLH